ncbi:hypothetical protein EDB19DRAFT_1693337 [Suillus lakei]|nr:hypothetical protein EDB19DRAFT_1693337 [Suillus lakei]
MPRQPIFSADLVILWAFLAPRILNAVISSVQILSASTYAGKTSDTDKPTWHEGESCHGFCFRVGDMVYRAILSCWRS